MAHPVGKEHLCCSGSPMDVVSLCSELHGWDARNILASGRDVGQSELLLRG